SSRGNTHQLILDPGVRFGSDGFAQPPPSATLRGRLLAPTSRRPSAITRRRSLHLTWSDPDSVQNLQSLQPSGSRYREGAWTDGANRLRPHGTLQALLPT